MNIWYYQTLIGDLSHIFGSIMTGFCLKISCYKIKDEKYASLLENVLAGLEKWTG